MQPDIVVLDDTPSIVDVFSIILKMNNFTVRTANCIHSLFNEIQHKIPDLLIIDSTIGEIDGRKVCKELKSQFALQNVPVLLMSASPSKLINYKEYYADDILEKPFDLQTMMLKVTSLINKKTVTN